VAEFSYASVYPLPLDSVEKSWPEPDIFMTVEDGIQIEDVSKLIKETPTTFWKDWSYEHGELESKRLQNVRYALVRRFDCEESEELEEREQSKVLLYRLYLTLKVIRPTKQRFLVLHYAVANGRTRIKEPWRNDFDSELLDCESGFPLTLEDLKQLPPIARLSLKILGDRKFPVTQAVYNLEIGYRAEFFSVRHLLWVVGIDALFSSKKWAHQGADVVRKRVVEFLGKDFAIYPNDRDFGLPRLVGLSLDDALAEIYRLRNYFAHGSWPNKSWAGKHSRPLAFGGGHVNYSGVLLESAAAILRGCLRKILSDANWIEIFNDKKRMNKYFADRGLVRMRRTICVSQPPAQ
jgi:hypothetical protein